MKVTHNSDGNYTIKCTKAELDIIAGSLSTHALYDSMVSNGNTNIGVYFNPDPVSRATFGAWSERNRLACNTIENATGKYSGSKELPKRKSIEIKLGGPGQND